MSLGINDTNICPGCRGQHLDAQGHHDPWEYAACEENHSAARSFFCLPRINGHESCFGERTMSDREPCGCECHGPRLAAAPKARPVKDEEQTP